MFSKSLWTGLTDEIGADVEWIEEGSLKLAYTEEDLSHFEEWARDARGLGLDTRVLTRDEVKREIPALEGAFVGGIHTPSDGQTEPRRATEAIAWAARERGVALHTGRAVEGLEVESGAVKTVVTDKGRIETDKGCVCGGGLGVEGRADGGCSPAPTGGERYRRLYRAHRLYLSLHGDDPRRNISAEAGRDFLRIERHQVRLLRRPSILAKLRAFHT